MQYIPGTKKPKSSTADLSRYAFYLPEIYTILMINLLRQIGYSAGDIHPAVSPN
jgi:hypothetical protein